MIRTVCILAAVWVGCGGGSDDPEPTQLDAAAVVVDGAAGADGGASVDGSVVVDAEGPALDAASDAASDGGTNVGTMDGDPAPGVDAPGEHGGPGCPDADETMFALTLGDVSSHVFTGTVTDVEGSGRFYVRGEGTQEVFGGFATDPTTGSYSVEIPVFCGEQLVKLWWSNSTCGTAVVYQVTTSDCTTPDLRITLVWDSLGDDWELHLVKPEGQINDNLTDCTWTSCIGQSPDWGVVGDPADDPSKDVDNTDSFGPENIVLSGPETGSYTIMVEHWSAAGSPLSDGAVIINIAGQPITVVHIQDLPPRSVWTAATVEFPGGTVSASTEVFDCSANWSSGCREVIP